MLTVYSCCWLSFSELLAIPSVVYTKYSLVRQDLSLFYLNMPKAREDIQIQIKDGISGSHWQLRWIWKLVSQVKWGRGGGQEKETIKKSLLSIEIKYRTVSAEPQDSLFLPSHRWPLALGSSKAITVLQFIVWNKFQACHSPKRYLLSGKLTHKFPLLHRITQKQNHSRTLKRWCPKPAYTAV